MKGAIKSSGNFNLRGITARVCYAAKEYGSIKFDLDRTQKPDAGVYKLTANFSLPAKLTAERARGRGLLFGPTPAEAGNLSYGTGAGDQGPAAIAQ